MIITLTLAWNAINQTQFPDAAMLDLVQRLRKSGTLVGLADGLGYRRDSTRLEVAVAVNATMSHLDRILSGPGAKKEIEADPEVGVWLRDSYWDLRRLYGRLQPEFRTLQATEETQILLTRLSNRYDTLGIALDNFRDVPTNHWASLAVKNLKDEGLLRGYPSGKFGG